MSRRSPSFEPLDRLANISEPQQYRERAKLIRRQVETLSNADVRRQLLAIADQYDRLAERMEQSRWG
jgi:hypothetical protein